MNILKNIIIFGQNALSQSISSRLALFVFVIVGFIIYANSFAASFFWDDDDYILNNLYIRSWQYLPKYFSENLIAGAGLLSNYWRPLLLINFSLDYHFFGLNKYWWHFVNITLHILNGFLAFLILNLLFKKKWLGFLTALIFLIHPAQIEAVTYLSGRTDSLFAFFFLLSAFFYLKYKERRETRFYIFSLLGFLASLFSKETAIVLPAILVILEIVRNEDLGYSAAERKKISLKNFIFLAPFFFLAAIYFIGRLTILNFSDTLNFYNDDSLFAASIWMRLLTFLKVFWQYLGLLFIPNNLHMERLIEPALSFRSNLWLIFPLIIIIAAFIFSLLFFKKNKLYFFGFFWFFIILAPTSNILIPINGLMYEHWLYLPLIGFFIFIFALFKDMRLFFEGVVSDKIKKAVKIAGIFILLFYLLFLAAATVKRNFVWQNPVAFFENNLKYNPLSLKLWNNLGMEYAEAGELDKAINGYKRAIELDIKNQSAPPHHNLANAYRDKGMFKEAEKEYDKAIAIDKNFYFSYNNLTSLYLENKEYNKAIEILRKELEIFPQDPVLKRNLEIIEKIQN